MRILVLVLALHGWSPPAYASPAAPSDSCTPYSTVPEVDAFLADHREAYALAIARATGWLDRLALDPVALPVRVKPKKKFVELLDTYLRLVRVGAGDPEALRARIGALAATTDQDAYHDMRDVDDRTFKQNATSYLRAAYILDRVGVDTTRYRAEIARVHARLNAHMDQRGPHQRAAFHTYYAHFGLEEPFPLAGALSVGLVARRADPTGMNLWDAYGITHEVFVPYDYGEDLDAEPFDAAELRYLRRTLATLTDAYLEKGDPDLVAELVSCMRYIRATDLPQYLRGLEMLFATQAADGHWGDYERFRARDGEYVSVKYELHTTAVAIDALTIAFHPEWNRSVAPIVPTEP